MSNLLRKTTSAVAGLAIVFSIMSPIAGTNAAMSGVDAANTLAQSGVIVDQSNNPSAYRLGDTITRREQTKVAIQLAACKGIELDTTYNGDFADMGVNDWGTKYAETALANGIVSENENFYPARLVSKAEALKMIMNSTGVMKSENASWEAAYVEGATSASILDNSFTDYTTAATRGWIFDVAAAAMDICKGNVVDDVIDDTITDEDDTTEEEDTTDEVVEGGTLRVTLSPENPQSVYAPQNVPRVKMLAFDVKAGDNDVQLNAATLFQVGPGDKDNVDDVAIYNSDNQKVSNTRSFGTDELEINFNRDIVVKAGERETFYIAGMIKSEDNNNNTMYQIRLADLDTTATVEGDDIVGPLMAPIAVTNSGKIEFDNSVNLTDSKIEVGKEAVLAAFSLEETEDNEDLVVKTITLEQVGKVSPEYIENLSLYADGEEVATDLVVNGSDELVINKDIVIPMNQTVRFELRGTVTGDVNETIGFELDSFDDIYAVGATTGYTIGFENSSDNGNDIEEVRELSYVSTIEGAEIDAVFTRVDKDQVKPDTDGFVAGTLKFTANSADYTIERLVVKTPNGADYTDLVSNVKVGNYTAEDDEPANGEYIFEDIYLTKGKTIELPLEMDVERDATVGESLKFDIFVERIEDETNRRVTYTDSSNPTVNSILSTNDFTTRNISIQNANVTVTPVKLTKNNVVSGTGVEVVGYKAKISAGDADDVLVRGMTFEGEELNDKVSRATLLVGSESYNGTVTNDTINFNTVAYDLDAGATDVETTLVLTLKSNMDAGTTINLNLSDVLAYNSDNNEITITGLDTNSNYALVEIQESGKAEITIDESSSNDDMLEDTVLAGSNNVVLAKLDLEAQNEDMKVKDLTLTYTGDFSNALSNVKIVTEDGTTIASGASVIGQTIEFNNDFVLMDADNRQDAYLVADIAIIDQSGGTIDFEGGNFQLTGATYKATGMASAEDQDGGAVVTINGNGETVNVVMTKIVPSVVSTFSDGTAKIKLTADSGNNKDASGSTPDVVIEKLTFVDEGNYDASETDAYVLRKDGEAANEIQGVKSGNLVEFDFNGSSVDADFDNSNTYVIRAKGTSDKTYGLTMSGDAIVYTVGGAQFTYNVSSDMSFGSKTY